MSLAPTPALFYPPPVVALFFIESKSFQQFAGKFLAMAAMLMPFRFAARFYGTAFSPKGLLNIHTAPAVHLFAVSAFAA